MFFRGLVMGMAVSRDGAFALTVSADHIVGKYDFKVSVLVLDAFEHSG